MKIVIVGAGEIGTHLAVNLSSNHHSIVVVEEDELIAEEIDSKIDCRMIIGDGASPEVLIEADVPGCDVFYALTSDNNINLVACTVAKQFQAKRTVCRIHPSLESQRVIFDCKEHFGADEIFSSERLAAVQLAKYVRNPDSDISRVVEELAGGYIELIELPVEGKSKVIGQKLMDIVFPERVRICVIKRDNQIKVPAAQDRILEGDVLTIAGPQRAVNEVINIVEPNHKNKQSNIVIFGGGEYGFALAQTLANSGGNYRIRIFESDRDRCAIINDKIANVTVLNCDATALAELKEENVGDADFFVATTTKDEDNVMTCLQAHNLGATHCLTLFHRADYADAITNYKGQMGILAAVSPREATSTMLMRFVSDSFHLLRQLDGAELIETSVAEGSVAAGKLVREVEWPEGSILVGLWHGDEVKVPSADDEINAGDNLYVMVTKKSKKGFLNLVAN